MGQLENGSWVAGKILSESSKEFKRQEQKFRNRIKQSSPFEPEAQRYHLYVSLACPWAHRTLIMRKLKKLETAIPVSIVSPKMLENGWSFEEDLPEATGDRVYKKKFLHEIYTLADENFSGKVTVPVLLDTRTKKIVNNESSEVLRILNHDFNELTEERFDYYPEEHRGEIDEINADVYENINNGVYRTGFTTDQHVYEENFEKLFLALDRIEERLRGREYLVGERLTEADIRLYTTLVRFDPVYYVHFKCNRTLIREFPHLSGYLRRLYAIPAFRETTNFEHIKTHYYFSHPELNPTRIIPRGPGEPVSKHT